MNTDPYHVIKHKKGWAVWRSGGKRCISVWFNKCCAEIRGETLAELNNTVLYIHDESGKVVRKCDRRGV